MCEINIAITGDELEAAAAVIIVARAFIDIGALNIVSPKLSEQTLLALEKHLDPEVIERCKNSCKITIT